MVRGEFTNAVLNLLLFLDFDFGLVGPSSSESSTLGRSICIESSSSEPALTRFLD